MNLAAFTEASAASYPQYVSINREGEMVEVIVRSPATAEGACGVTAVCKMGMAEFVKMVRAVALGLLVSACSFPADMDGDLVTRPVAVAPAPDRTIQFSCDNAGKRLLLTITVEDSDTEMAVNAYLANPTKDAANALVAWMNANRPSSVDSANNIVAYVIGSCST